MEISKKFNKNFFLIFFATLITKFGDASYYISFNYYIYQKTKSALIVGNSLIITLIPTIFLGPWIGLIVDKYSKKFLMVMCDFIRFFLLVGIVFFSNNIIMLFLIQLIIGTLNQIFSTSNNSIIGIILNENNRIKGNSILSSVKSFMKVIGPAISGMLISIFSVKFIFMLNALSYICSGFLLSMMSISNSKSIKIKKEKKVIYKEYVNTVRELFKNKSILNIWISNNFLSIISAANNVLLLVWVSTIFKNNSSSIYGILSSALAMGMLLGSLFSIHFIKKFSDITFNRYALLGTLSIIIFSINFNIFISIFTRVILGFSYSTTAIIMNSKIQSEVNTEHYGKTFSFLQMFDYILTIIFIWIFGICNRIISCEKIFLVIGSISMISILILMINSTRRDINNKIFIKSKNNINSL